MLWPVSLRGLVGARAAEWLWVRLASPSGRLADGGFKRVVGVIGVVVVSEGLGLAEFLADLCRAKDALTCR